MATRVEPIPLLGPGQRLSPIQRFRRAAAARYAKVRPSRDLLRGAALGVDLLAILAMAFVFTYTTTPLGDAVEFVIGAALGLLLVLLGDLVRTLLSAVVRIFPRPLLTALLGLIAVGMIVPQNLPPLAFYSGVLLLFGCAGVLGGFVYRIARGGFAPMPAAQRVATFAIVIAAAAVLIYTVVWLLTPGFPVDLPAYTPPSMAGVTPLAVENPGLPGPYAVETAFYGSGTDIRRPEYGPGVALTTPPVDASDMLPPWTGWTGTVYSQFWGFNTDALPLNGRVWYPAGEGPFPIVLIVHGNHDMGDFSDPGYAYLGEHLASRGFITVSVDENFLNGSSIPFTSVEGEQDVRGWLLLRHLAQWRSWNINPASPFYGKVDLENVALIGHSRGGEAVLTAASFNTLRYFPDNAGVQFDFHFGIRAIVAIAPADGQYWPAGRRTPLENVDYLTLQGAYDGDMAWFEGIRAYQRVAFTDDAYHFKAALYIDRANHGQFNTEWGRVDRPNPVGWFMNYAPIMDGEAQRQIALTSIGGFLEASLHGRHNYLPMFRDYRAALDWLPATGYISRFEDSTYQMLADFEGDIDLTTGTLTGTTLSGNNLTVWNENNAPMRRDWQENRVVYLGWNTPDGRDASSFRIGLPREGLTITPDMNLVFTIGDQARIPEVEGGLDAGDSDALLDFTVLLTEADGSGAQLALSEFGSVPHPFQSAFVKSGFFDNLGFGERSSEVEMGTVSVPLARFTAANPGLDVTALRSITLIFDRIPAGTIQIGEIGLSR